MKLQDGISVNAWWQKQFTDGDSVAILTMVENITGGDKKY